MISLLAGGQRELLTQLQFMRLNEGPGDALASALDASLKLASLRPDTSTGSMQYMTWDDPINHLTFSTEPVWIEGKRLDFGLEAHSTTQQLRRLKSGALSAGHALDVQGRLVCSCGYRGAWRSSSVEIDSDAEQHAVGPGALGS